MEIHNLMEDKVLQIMKEICEEEEHTRTNLYCTSEQCRLDAACYVLNRVPQRYVTSGRGFAYLESDFYDNTQLQVDIVTLCHEGLRRVTAIRRNFYAEEISEVQTPDCEFGFNFPLIKGRLLNGITFEPIKDVNITFRLDNELVPMVDSRWPNPYSIVGNTPGTYLFWPKPVPATEAEQERLFEFELSVESQTFEAFHHFFTIKLDSQSMRVRDVLRPQLDFHLPDLFLIPKGIVEEMQENPSSD